MRYFVSFVWIFLLLVIYTIYCLMCFLFKQRENILRATFEAGERSTLAWINV